VKRLQRMVLGGLVVLLAGLLGACFSHAPSRVPAGSQVRMVAKVSKGQYRVRRGDTLYSIARRHGWDWKALAAHNRIVSPYTLRVGQMIRFDNRPLPPPARPAPVSRSSTRRTAPAVSARAGAAGRPAAAAKPAPRPQPVKPAAMSAAISAIQWHWPSDGSLIGRFNGNNGLNKGIDIAGTQGQPVQAAADGLVTYAGNGLYGNGEALIILHGSSMVVSVYGHNRRLLVQEGQQVKAGQVIAEMGASGTDRVKLHFEIRHQNKAVDPLLYLPKR